MNRLVRTQLLAALLLSTVMAAALPVAAQAQAATPGEQRASRALQAADKLGPQAVYALLKPFPKGADLHMHLSGAVYAETFLGEAVRQGLCIDDSLLKLDAPKKVDGKAACATGLLPASSVLAGSTVVDPAKHLTGQELYDELVDSFSMRAFVPSSGVDGHDQFFATFARFGAASDPGEWLDEVAARAASQNEQYLEIMQTPSFSHAAGLGYQIGWPSGAETSIDRGQLTVLRNQLLAAGLKEEVATDLKQFSDALARRDQIENCAALRQHQGELDDPNLSHGVIMELEQVQPGCSVEVHFLYQVLRAFPPQQVFAQTLLGFETVLAAQKADPASPMVVGINFVQPEDDRRAMADYTLQMQMLEYLHSVYPTVPISLHAGELAPGMVPPVGLTFHIRQAVEMAHALRIGHGVDVLHEDPWQPPVPTTPVVQQELPLLQEMAARHIMVEINLTSNAVILGIAGKDHPLHAYMAAHVPWALSTDDEGVSRIDLTHEYVRGVTDQSLTYLDLKQSARTSLEHAFLAGGSLWAHPDEFTRRVAACAGPVSAHPAAACAAYLAANERARQQYELERRMDVFEAHLPTLP